MTGGAITANTVGEGTANPVSNPKPNGGGIYIAYATMSMTGGEIMYNQALNWLGGGIFISGALEPAEFNMAGGSVNYNFAQVSGGGIYLECGTAATMDGEIEIIGNEAKGISLYNGWYYYAGGGIYVNGGVNGYQDATLTIKKVIITENTAAANGQYTGNDSSNRGYAYGYGSGLAACNTGNVKLYLTDGGAIYNNQSKSTASNGKYNNVQVYITKGDEVDLQISKYMLGGSLYQWMDWSGTKAVDVDSLSRASTIFLYPKPTEDAIRTAETLGTIIVRGNQTDSIGGGIAVNGTLVIGSENAGSLSVSKTVSGSGGSTSQEFVFTVTFTGDDLAKSYRYIMSDSDEIGTLALNNGEVSFNLKHDQTITITGLPAGITFQVTESHSDGYTVTSSFGDQAASNTMTGTIPKDNTAAVTFHNQKDSSDIPDSSYTSVSVKKVWKLDDGGTATDTVQVALLRNGETYDTVMLTPQNDWSYTWHRLDDSYTWMVQEMDIPNGFTVSVDRTPGNNFTIINDDQPGTAPPDPTPKTGMLTVSKRVSGTLENTQKEFHFTVTLSDTTLAGIYGEMTFSGGVATFTLTHGESKAAANLPAGIAYEVAEQEANEDGYTTTSVGKSGTIVADATTEVIFNNYKDGNTLDGSGASVSVKKIWKLDSGGTATDAVQVALLQNGEVYATVILNADNDWSYTWSDLDNSYTWTVQEMDVPAGFTVSIDQTSSNSFTITNDDQVGLPQTGQLWWPAALVMVLGSAMFLAGMRNLRNHHRHGKDER